MVLHLPWDRRLSHQQLAVVSAKLSSTWTPKKLAVAGFEPETGSVGRRWRPREPRRTSQQLLVRRHPVEEAALADEPYALRETT
jgi:hypothetical protein